MKWLVCLLAGTECMLIGGIVWLCRRHRRLHRLSANRLRLLQHLIELRYLYGERPPVFVRKFQEQTSVSKLKEAGIIHWNRPAYGTKMTDDELLLYRLIKTGFSRKAICAVFDLKSINSLYVKFHRLKKKFRLPD